MSSPFFIQPRRIAGQMSMSIGTHHACGSCHNSYICDLERCPLPLHTVCGSCSGNASTHAELLRLQDAAAEETYWREIRQEDPQGDLFAEVEPC